MVKLRNKKTGEIRNAVDIDMYTDSVYLKVSNGEFDNETIEYRSLAEFNEEWEDYEEEAKKAPEKLEAWKRLEDKGFKFKGWRTADLGADKYYFMITAESDGAGKGDLDLLFGGEE